MEFCSLPTTQYVCLVVGKLHISVLASLVVLPGISSDTPIQERALSTSLLQTDQPLQVSPLERTGGEKLWGEPLQKIFFQKIQLKDEVPKLSFE